jgi:hypothetical protein
MADSFDIIYTHLGIQADANGTDDEILQLIIERVNHYLELDIDLLMSYLYRLDIDEDKINIALMPSNPDPANVALAKLILERQIQRTKFKQQYIVKPIEDGDWDF